MIPKKTYTIITVLFAIAVFGSCTRDKDETNNDKGMANGKVTFTISGDINGTKEGTSSIVTVEGDNPYYLISNHDGNSNDDHTFSLTFYKNFIDNSITHPQAGTYPIESVANLSNQEDFGWFLPIWLVGKNILGKGTISIVSNSNNQLKGTFDFIGTESYGTQGEIKVSHGQFSATIN